MLRKTLNSILRLTGWSAIGHRVRLLCGEGPFSDDLAGATGEVLKFKRGDGMTSDIFIIKLKPSIVLPDKTIAHVLLVPRHAGYSHEALAMTSISAYVFEIEPTLSEDLPAWNEMIAIMDIELI